jgi:hypothetical protein
MPRFTVRVELVELDDGSGDVPDYDLLHEALESERIYRTVLGRDGVRRQLPDATYNCDGTNAPAVLRRTRAGATNAWRGRARIVVTQSAARLWHNLTPVD